MARDDDDRDGGRKEDICKVLMKDVRLSYPQLYRAKAFGDGSQGEPAYSAEFLIPKDTSLGKKIIDMIDDAIYEAKQKKWEGKDVKISKDKPFFKDGDDRDYERPETIDHMIVSARNVKKPRLLGIDKEDLHESDGVLYAGCKVDAIVRVWAQDNKYGKRINCSLEAVRFRGDGDPFGAAPINVDEFEDIESGGSERRGRTIDGTSRRVRDEDDDRAGRRGDSRQIEDRRGRDDDDRGSRRGGREEESDDDRSARRSRDAEGGDDDRSSRRSNRDDDDRGSSRGRSDEREERGGRGRDDDDRGGRGRDRDERNDDRGARRSSREDDDRGRGRDDDDRGSRRSTRDEVDDRDRPSERSRSSGRGRGDDRDIV